MGGSYCVMMCGTPKAPLIRTLVAGASKRVRRCMMGRIPESPMGSAFSAGAAKGFLFHQITSRLSSRGSTYSGTCPCRVSPRSLTFLIWRQHLGCNEAGCSSCHDSASAKAMATSTIVPRPGRCHHLAASFQLIRIHMRQTARLAPTLIFIPIRAAAAVVARKQ